MQHKIITYDDLVKVNNITSKVDIYIYMEVIYMTPKFRISTIKGLMKFPIYTISNMTKAIQFDMYKLSLRDYITPLTKIYRKKYEWFDKHIQIEVPNRTGMYFHIGNYYNESDGCELIGNSHIPYTDEDGNQLEMVTNSVKTYTEFYKVIYPWLTDKDKNVYLHIV